MSSDLPTRPPPSLVVPVIGINSNIVVNGVEFHVQTEDMGPRHGHLITQVFRDGGRVVKSVKLDYSQHTDKSNLHSILPRVMRAHHAKLIRSLQQGRLDSIPPCVTMRRSMAQQPPRLDEIAREAGIEDLPDAPHSTPPSTVRSNARPSNEDAQLNGAPSSSNLWDKLIEEAHRGHPVGLAHDARGELKPAFSAWDRAVESTRHGTQRNLRKTDELPLSVAALAEAAYKEGLDQMRGADDKAAVVNLARAVQLAPDNREYRAALRNALDRLDEHA